MPIGVAPGKVTAARGTAGTPDGEAVLVASGKGARPSLRRAGRRGTIMTGATPRAGRVAARGMTVYVASVTSRRAMWGKGPRNLVVIANGRWLWHNASKYRLWQEWEGPVALDLVRAAVP